MNKWIFVIMGVLVTSGLGLSVGPTASGVSDGVANADRLTTSNTSPAPDSLADEGIAESEDVTIDVSIQWSNASPNTVTYVFTFTGTSSSEFELVTDETINSMNGFSQDSNGYWEYDAIADTHRVEIQQSVKDSASHHDWVYSADSGVLVGAPHVKVQWVDDNVRYDENPLIHDYTNVEVTFHNHSGFREYRRVYVGAHTTYSGSYNGSTYTVFVPQLAGSDNYTQIIRSIASHSDFMPFDDGIAHAEFVVFPDGESANDSVSTYTASAAAGQTYSGAPEAILEDDVRWNSYNNPYVHEYTHIEAEWWERSANNWLSEAQAEYLTAMNMHRVGCGDGDLGSFIEAKSSTQDDVLSDQSTWETATPYEKGFAVTSDFSAWLYNQSGGTTTMNDVFATMEDDTIDTHKAFVDAVNQTVNDAQLNMENGDYLDKYVTTSDYPSRIDQPPVDRTASCLDNYQHIDVTETTHEGRSESMPTTMPTLTIWPSKTGGH